MRSPATPSINTEHPSTLNERVFLIPFPLRTPAFTLLRYPSIPRLFSCAPVTMLRNRDAGARDERGRMGGAGVVSRRRYRPLSNPVATLKGNRRKRGCGAFNSSRFRLMIFARKERRAVFIAFFSIIERYFTYVQLWTRHAFFRDEYF